jgi:hypothetical protein
VIWSIEDPLRWRREREALEALAGRAGWLVPGEWRVDSSIRLIWDADIVIGDRTYPISLRYSNHFPHSPPVVLPRGDAERRSSHQYGAGGELCLEYGPDNWHPELTGADMVESAHRLLAGERPSPGQTGQVASRHATTLGQDLRGKGMRFLITRDLASFMDSLGEGELREGRVVCTWRERSVVYTVKSASLADGQQWTDRTIPDILADEGYERPVALCRWPHDGPLPSLKSRAEFYASAAANNVSLLDIDYALLAQAEALHAYLLWKDDDTATRIPVIPAQPADARVHETHAALAERRVAIVGCGSLGGKIAAMLARSGVGYFFLVDDDLLLPDNLVRHELDWREMGRHKTDGVARRIKLVNAAANCETRQHRLGGQESSGSVETLIETLSKCDLIVDATADPKVFNYLSAAVAIGKKPLVWAEVFGGGFGGLIARHRPGLEPSPATMRAAIEQWCFEQGKPIERAANDYEGRSSGAPLIASDADVAVIAAHAARFALDILLPRPSIFPSSVYLIGLAEGWVFEQPFDTRPIDVGPPEAKEEIPVDPAVAAEETARLIELIKNLGNASGPDTTGSSAAAD